MLRLTNLDGRSSGFLSWRQFLPGVYKMFFNTGAYFTQTGIKTFYPFAEVMSKRCGDVTFVSDYLVIWRSLYGIRVGINILICGFDE